MAVNLNTATVIVNNPLTYSKAETNVFVFCGEERVKDARLILRFDPAAVVAHAKLYAISLFGYAKSDRHMWIS